MSDCPPSRVDLERGALTRAEYISAMVHFYRGEMHRATAWRLRLDNTTNWAILSTGGLLTFSFGHPGSSHLVLLLGQVLLFSFLWIESRRYRFFDVWRSRVRKIEENFLNPLLTRRLESPDPLWGDDVAMDLSHPKFKMSRWHALHQRFRSNYVVLFLVMFVAWLSKLFIHPVPTRALADVTERMEVGIVPWWITVVAVWLAYTVLAFIYLVPGSATALHGQHWGLGEEVQEEQ
ncbi:MAG: DUF2270 domain-containing protein [Gemmatimonadota bacterium]|nr:DUF2270 domain-containing protein [Gemmatimonadota bacterium]